MNASQLLERVKAILLNPKATWENIKGETTTVSKIYGEYLMPLAAIPAVAAFIGHSLVGVHLPFMGYYRTPIISGLVSAVLTYGLTLAGIFIVAKVIDALAPTFGASKNDLNAFKVAAYAWTPALVAGILSILPILAPLGLLAGLYGIYLLYLGLLSLMACPAEKAVAYTATSVVAVIVIYALVGLVVGALTVGARQGIGGMGQIRNSAAEQIVAAKLAGQGIKMNLADGKVTVQTKEGTATYSGGGGTQIPDTFPKDVYVPEGATVLASVTMPQGCNVTLTTKTGAEKVLAAFKDKMTAAGWTEAMSLKQGEQSMLTYQKGNRTASVVISSADQQTQVQLTVVEDKDAANTESKK